MRAAARPMRNPDREFVGNGVSELIDLSLRALLNRATRCWCFARLPLLVGGHILNDAARSITNATRPMVCPTRRRSRPWGPRAPAPRHRADQSQQPDRVDLPANCWNASSPSPPSTSAADGRRDLRPGDGRRREIPAGSATGGRYALPDLQRTEQGPPRLRLARGWALLSVRAKQSATCTSDDSWARCACAQVPGQYAGKRRSTAPIRSRRCARRGTLYETRVRLSKPARQRATCPWWRRPVRCMPPGVVGDAARGFDDHDFALEMMETEGRAGGAGFRFNVPYRNHFRVTLLRRPKRCASVFAALIACWRGAPKR